MAYNHANRRRTNLEAFGGVLRRLGPRRERVDLKVFFDELEDVSVRVPDFSSHGCGRFFERGVPFRGYIS